MKPLINKFKQIINLTIKDIICADANNDDTAKRIAIHFTNGSVLLIDEEYDYEIMDAGLEDKCWMEINVNPIMEIAHDLKIATDEEWEVYRLKVSEENGKRAKERDEKEIKQLADRLGYELVKK